MKNAEKLFPAIREARKQRFERNQRQDGDIRNHEFSRGDKVYLHFPKGRFRPVGGSTKFSKVNDGPYTVVLPREDDLICKVRHDTTGYVSNVFVGRMIPCEKRDDSRDDADFPYPLAQLPSRPSHSLADSGAGAKTKTHLNMILISTSLMRRFLWTWKRKAPPGKNKKSSQRNNPGEVADDQRRVTKLLLQIHRN